MKQRIIKFRAYDKYEIGTDGSIWSTDFNNSGKRRQLKVYKDHDGYNTVYFTIKGVRRIYPVRKLVAESFIGKRPQGLVINHKNGIRDDDRAENLEYITSQANTIDGWNRGRKISEKHRENGRKMFGGENNPKAKVDKEKVGMIRLMRKDMKWSLKQLSKHWGISIAQVGAICTNRNWK